MPSLWAGLDNEQQYGDDPTQQTPPQQKQQLHETFLQRQARLGKMPNSANRTMYPQASNLKQAQVAGDQPRTADYQPQVGPPAPAPQAPPPPAPTTATRYAGYSKDPNQAFASLNAKYKAKHGQDIPQAYVQQLASYAGFTGGEINPDQWDKAAWAVENFDPKTGNLPAYSAPAAQSATPVAPATAGPQQPNPGGFNPTPGWGVATPPAYQPDTANLPEFQSTQFTQFQAPDQSGTTGKMGSLLDQILLSPDTLGETQVNQMKSRAKESALEQAKQLRGAASENLASRGFSGGGMEAGANRAVDNQLLNDLITSNREIDIEAASTNRADRLNALGAGDSFLNSQLQRATQGYTTGLAGQEAQAQDRRAGSAFGLQRWQAGEEASRAANDSEFRNAELQFDQMSDDRKQRLSEFLGVEAVNLDKQKFAEMQTQFKTATGLDLLKFLENTRQFNQSFGENQRQFNTSLGENSRQFNATTGLQTAQLQQTGQNNLMNWLAQAYGI